MLSALREAEEAFSKNEVPIGAVIVYKNKIIAKSGNQVEALCDPTAHAEILAITQACAYLKSKWLSCCTMYVTIEPCSMCVGALILSRIERLVFGASDLKTGALGSKVDINALRLNHKLKVKQGVLEAETSQIIKDFFRAKRNKISY